MSIYKEAVFKGITFPTNKGELLISQIPTLSLNDLSITLKNLNKKLKQNDTNDLDFLDDSKTVDKTLELQFEILKDVYLTKKETLDKLKEENDKKAFNQKILSLIAEDEEKELRNLTKEEKLALLK